MDTDGRVVQGRMHRRVEGDGRNARRGIGTADLMCWASAASDGRPGPGIHWHRGSTSGRLCRSDYYHFRVRRRGGWGGGGRRGVAWRTAPGAIPARSQRNPGVPECHTKLTTQRLVTSPYSHLHPRLPRADLPPPSRRPGSPLRASRGSITRQAARDGPGRESNWTGRAEPTGPTAGESAGMSNLRTPGGGVSAAFQCGVGRIGPSWEGRRHRPHTSRYSEERNG